MTTATAAARAPVSRTRLSQLILEGAGALVATVLTLWLLLWFLWQHPKLSNVVAVHVPAYDVPYQEADVRSLSGRGQAEVVTPALGAELTTKLVEVADQPGPPAVVIALSAPTIGDLGGGKTPVELVKQVARGARRNVLLVLDLAQIDSDRDLGVFGNAPYRGLQDELAKLPKGKADVFVLCSSAPGQKSWMADGLGRSIFLYFVQQGLAGKARGWDDSPGGRGAITVNGLHRYVLWSVAEWVKAHRQAVQTPVLLPVGANVASFALPPIAVPPRVGSLVPPTPKEKEKDKDKDKAAEKATTPAVEADPWDGLLAALLKEWKEHEALRGRNPAPQRYLPAGVRLYQSALLQAERMVRQARHDPGFATQARKGIAEASRRRSQLLEALDDREKAEKLVPFRPVLDDEEGKRTLNDSLVYLTGRGLPELAAKLPIEPPKPPPGEKAADARKANVEANEVVLPHALPESFPWPQTFLELQLPAWAHRFNQEYKVDHFKDELGGLLRLAVLHRLDAEAALASDRRGLDWIREVVRDGDEGRRQVQDAVFSVGLGNEALNKLAEQAIDFGRTYDGARTRIEKYRAARALLERIAVELPYYADWMIEAHARAGADSDDVREGILPRPLATALRATAGLALALERGHSSNRDEAAGAFDPLGAAQDDAAKAFGKVRDDYQQSVATLYASRESTGWRGLDEALRTPLVALETREALLRRIVELETAEPEPLAPPERGEGAANPWASAPADPGFWRKALGLAELEVALLSLASSDPKSESAAGDAPKLLKALAESSPGAVGGEAVARTLASFEEVTQMLRTARSRLPGDRLTGPGGDENRPEVEVGKDLRAADRALRFRTANDLRRAGGDDWATRELDDLGRRQALLFHAERLGQDYARDVDGLVAAARELYARAAAPKLVLPHGTLRARVEPEETKVDERGKSRVRVTVEVTGDRPGAGDARVPRGEAFVGAFPVEAAPSKPAEGAPKVEEVRLKVALADPARREVASRLVGDHLEVGQGRAQPLEFSVTQEGNSSDGVARKVQVKVFYRGQVDDSSKREVTVFTRDFGPPITIGVAQNREALDLKYGKELSRRIADQFEEHPDLGCMHFRKELDYVLTFKNERDVPQDVTIVRTMEPEGGGKPPVVLDRVPITRTLKPGEVFTLRRQVTSVDIPVETPMEMNVKVLDAKKTELAARRITFKQLKLEEYISIATRQGRHFIKSEGQEKFCFLVEITRRKGDPVTEPILYKDLQFAINGEAPKNDLPAGGMLDRGGMIIVFFPLGLGEVVKDWRVVVEGESRSGKQ